MMLKIIFEDDRMSRILPSNIRNKEKDSMNLLCNILVCINDAIIAMEISEYINRDIFFIS